MYLVILYSASYFFILVIYSLGIQLAVSKKVSVKHFQLK